MPKGVGSAPIGGDSRKHYQNITDVIAAVLFIRADGDRDIWEVSMRKRKGTTKPIKGKRKRNNP